MNATKLSRRRLFQKQRRFCANTSPQTSTVHTPKPGAWVNGTTYSRRHVLEGSVYSRKEGEGRYLVTSDASASPSVVPGYSFSPRGAGSFLALLESGNMGIWRGGFARPAVGNAQKEVDQMIVSVLKSRLG